MPHISLNSILRSIALMLLFSACKNKTDLVNNQGMGLLKDSLVYAKGFSLYHDQHSAKIVIKNPWQHAEDVQYEYLLNSKEAIGEIKIPLKKVVCLSTTHLAYIHQLGEDASVVGVTNTNLVSDSTINRQIFEEKTQNVGNEQALNYEIILNLKPDVIFAYGVGAEIQGIYQKFQEWGIPVVVESEYLEDSPLAKAEWIKFFAQFYQKQKVADSIFESTEQKYLALCRIAQSVTYRPIVMSSLPWKDVWYVPGGKSFMGKYIQDAGGNYIWASDSSRESLPLSVEKVFFETQNAEIWINAGMAITLSDIAAFDPRMQQLKPFKMNRVYNNTLRVNQNMGNDFWESGCVNPHLILSDLIQIFHPTLMNDVPFYYYQQLH